MLVKQPNSGMYSGIFLISFATLILEITLTKIFSVTLWYHFSYLVISLAMFGIGFGGLLVYRFKNQFKQCINENLYLFSVTQAISIVLSLYAAVSYSLPTAFDAHSLIAFILAYGLCTAPFVLSSMILSILFLNWPNRSSYIYGADLMGAAAGCIGCLLLISYFSAPQVILFSCIASIVAALFFSFPDRKLLSFFFIIIVAILMIYSHALFKVVQTKSYYSDEYQQVLFEKWSPLSRITVFPRMIYQNKDDTPFGWGMSSTFQPKEAFQQLWIEQDASAGTPIVPFDGDYAKVDFLKYDITALPYYLKKNGHIFILGVGGGRDVLTALLFGNQQITGVDIHPVIVDLIKNKFANYAGNIYSNKLVNIQVAEGRSFLAKSHAQFDVIQIPLIDSWAATVAGAFAMTENSLYTREAFLTYIEHLTPAGILSVSRFYFTPDNQTIKTAILARESLEKYGIEHPENHLVIVKNSPSTTERVGSTLLVKREPFTVSELDRIQALITKFKFVAVYLPHSHQNEPLFQEALTTKNLSQFVKKYYYDIRPNSDDRPFFFQMFYFSKVRDLFSNKKITGQAFNYFGVAVIFFLLIISIVLVLFMYIGPLLLMEQGKPPPWHWGGYFIALGLGFMLIEIPFLQQGAVYLGNPMYGLSVGLFGLLLFGGIGSMASSRCSLEKLPKILMMSMSVVILVSTALPWYFSLLMYSTHGQAWGMKLGFFVLVLFPTALCMGVALPGGLRLAQINFSASSPWFWGLNGAASVLGSIMAMALSMAFGYSLTLTCGALSYLIAAGLVVFRDKQPFFADKIIRPVDKGNESGGRALC